MDELRNKKCHKCKCYRYPHDFIKDGCELKTCINCREFSKKYRIKNHCKHNKYKEYCKDCKRNRICQHSKRKDIFKECGGSQICQHSKCKEYCKGCGGSQICQHSKHKSECKKCSDPIKVTISQWIHHCRYIDKKNSRYDADRFIDRCFLQGLVEDYDTCYYNVCRVKPQYILYQDDLATLMLILIRSLHNTNS